MRLIPQQNKVETNPGPPTGSGSAAPARLTAHGLERIYDEHRQGLFSLALSITGDRTLAEDAVHEGFVRLCPTGGASRPVQGDPVAYVFATIRNAALDEHRRGSARKRLTQSLISNGDIRPTDQHDVAPDQRAWKRERQELLRQSLDNLPGPTRQVIVLKLFSGLTFEQVAQILDEPLGTVTSRYRRALEQLREKVEHLR